MLRYLLGLSWYVQAFVAMFGMAAAWILIGMFMGKPFLVKPGVIIACYYAGIVLGSLGILFSTQMLSVSDFTAKPTLTLSAMLVGLTLGAGVNILFFNGLSQAPNQGLAVAILNFAAVVIFIAVLGLSRILPAFFQSGQINGWQVLGLVLSVIGPALLAVKR